MIGFLFLILFAVLAPAMSSHADTPSTNAPAATDAKAAAAHAMETDGCVVEKFTVHSPSMDRDIQALVVLPPGYKDHPDKKYPILYAMHGSAAPYDSFSQMAPLRARLKDEPMIVVCFDGDTGSMYIDAPLPQKWSRDSKNTSTAKSLFTTFFFDELVPYVDQHYRVNPKQRMLTGFSMGGYGAFHYMLIKPGMFASVSSMSGYFPVLTPPGKEELAWWPQLLGPYAGNETGYRAADVYVQLKDDLARGVKLPPIMLRCGAQDDLVVHNRQMRDFLKANGITCDYGETPGIHNWTFWRDTSPAIIDFHWRSLQGK